MNKENIPSAPSTPKTSKQVADPSPETRDILKLVNSNKSNHVGKLSFLQNDNIDEHFHQIHQIQNMLQQQLYGIEVQTKQIGVDIGQISDRLKNNNQHLNKLLTNITNYSQEVITEGNATKKDISNIIERLDSYNQQLSDAKSSDNQKEITEIKEKLEKISQTLAETSSKISQQANSDIIVERLDLIQQGLPKRDIVRQIIDPVIAELKSVELDARSQGLLQDILGILNKTKDDDFSTQKFEYETEQLLGQMKEKAEQFEKKVEEQLEEKNKLLAKQNAQLEEQKSQLEKQNTQLKEQTAQISELLEKLGLNVSVEELERKHSDLEKKYERMTVAYETKYNEFKTLQEHFKELAQSTNRLSVVPENSKPARLNKVRQLHSSKMNQIASEFDTSMSKRVVSTPLIRPDNNSDEE